MVDRLVGAMVTAALLCKKQEERGKEGLEKKKTIQDGMGVFFFFCQKRVDRY